MPDVSHIQQRTPQAQQFSPGPQPRIDNQTPPAPEDKLSVTSVGEKNGRVYTLATNADQTLRMQSWQNRGNGALYTRLDDTRTQETHHEVIIPRGLAPDQWIIQGKNGPQGMQWQAYPASRPQEIRQLIINPNDSKLQIPIGNPQNPSFLMFDPSTGDVAMGTPRQPQPDPAHKHAMPQSFQYLTQTVHADGSETLRTHEVVRSWKSWGMQKREIKYIEIQHRGDQVEAYEVTNKKTGFFPESWKRQKLDVAVRADNSYDVRGSNFSAHVPQNVARRDRPALHIDTFLSNPQKLAVISATAGSIVAAGVAMASQPGFGQPPASAPAPARGGAPTAGPGHQNTRPAATPTAAPSPPGMNGGAATANSSMGEAPPPPGVFAPTGSSHGSTPAPQNMPPSPLAPPNRAASAPTTLPGPDAAAHLVAQKQPEADRLMQLLQSATNPADPQVVAAQQRMESLGVELQALQAIAQGATPQMATQNLPVLSQQLQASEAGIMQAQQRGVQEDDAQFQQMVGQHMQMLQQNIGLTSLLLYAARQGVLPVDTSGPDPGMAKLPNPQAAAAELQQKQPEYEQLFSELNGAQGQPPPDKVAKFQQLGFELGALDALSAGVTPRQAVAQLKPTRDALEANVAELNRLNPDGSKTNDAAVQQKITEQVELHGRIEALESLILYAARNGALAL